MIERVQFFIYTLSLSLYPVEFLQMLTPALLKIT